ncbi:Ni/Fe hydrogenase subunit alpha [Patescibacteria group bacterium]|nr:Ni/Fe hydrogenase subunit alpha [Patescibacteria group bacterium]
MAIQHIQIDHVAKIEGHAGFIADIVKGDVKKAQMQTKVGARLIEGLIVGRHYTEPATITPRICGICPVIHNLTSVKAMEDALGIEVPEEFKVLRKIMLAGQQIQSHALHLFFLSLPDFLHIKNDINLVKSYEKETKKAILLRDFGNRTIEAIGARAVHPISSKVGGFKRLPDKYELKRLLDEAPRALKLAKHLANIFNDLSYPNFTRETEFIALQKEGEYPIYEGDLVTSSGKKFTAREFADEVDEFQNPDELINRVKLDGQTFMVGAISRLNLNHQNLYPEAQKILKESQVQLPTYNSFHNIIAQAVEMVHAVEEIMTLGQVYLNNPAKERKVKYKFKGGDGIAACEAPRGLLVHNYEVGDDEYVKNCRIMTPTAMFLTNLDEDLKQYLGELYEKRSKQREDKVRMLIRAYDPCITCATH